MTDYNTTALARHQREIDRQEAKEHWIAAAVDRLLADDEWLLTVSDDWSDNAIDYATLQAEREYQQHLSALEQARIDGQEGL